MDLENLSGDEGVLENSNLIAYSPGFREFCRRQYSAQSLLIGIKRGGVWAAVFPVFRRLLNRSELGEIPLPVYYAEPVFNPALDFKINPKELATELMDFLKLDLLSMNFYEIYSPGRILFGGFQTKFLAYIFDIGDETDAGKILMSKIDKKARNQIVAGLKNNPEITDLDIDEFYALYQKHRKRLGVGPREKSYFENLSQAFGANFKILGLKRRNLIIGANLFVFNKNYLWLINNVFDPDFAFVFPNNVLYWEMIRWGIGRGIRYFDYGGTAPGDMGLRHFKENFGGKPRPIYSKVFYKNGRARLKYWFEQKTRHLELRLRCHG